MRLELDGLTVTIAADTTAELLPVLEFLTDNDVEVTVLTVDAPSRGIRPAREDDPVQRAVVFDLDDVGLEGLASTIGFLTTLVALADGEEIAGRVLDQAREVARSVLNNAGT